VRSSKNPYYLYISSKNPQIQHLLKIAPSISDDEIKSLTAKKDLQRAMIYARGLARQREMENNLQVELQTPCHQQGRIYHYQGPSIECWINQHSSLIGDDFLFLMIGTRFFAWHNWFDVNTANNSDVLLHSRQVGFGDHLTYNQLLQTYLQQKHS
jgi:hypothetical protein